MSLVSLALSLVSSLPAPYVIIHDVKHGESWSFSRYSNTRSLDSASQITSYTRERKLLKIRVKLRQFLIQQNIIINYSSVSKRLWKDNTSEGISWMKTCELKISASISRLSEQVCRNPSFFEHILYVQELCKLSDRSCFIGNVQTVSCYHLTAHWSDPFQNVAHGPSSHTMPWNIVRKAIKVLKLV